MGSHGKAQPHIHAAGIVLHWSVEKFLQFGKRDDFVELGNDLGLSHAENRAVEKNVFASR